MSIEMIRIDDRLIHGQVVTAWSKSKSIQSIWVIDDEVNATPFLKNVMYMVAPANTELIITGEDEIQILVPQLDKSEKRTLVLVKNPRVANKLFEAGVNKRELNIGGMGASAERQKLYKNISASADEVKELEDIKSKGINVYFQVTPNDRAITFK